MKVELEQTERLFDGFLKLDRSMLRHEMPNGRMSPSLMRLNVERGDGAGALLVNRRAGTVVLTRQFRYANWKRGDGGFVIEVPAGVVPPGKAPEDVARQELIEEAGYHIQQLRFMLMFYASPGTTTERVYLYYAEVDEADRQSAGGGVDAEQEFIEVIEMPIVEAIAKMERGEIVDGKTVIALQWYQTHVAPR